MSISRAMIIWLGDAYKYYDYIIIYNYYRKYYLTTNVELGLMGKSEFGMLKYPVPDITIVKRYSSNC